MIAVGAENHGQDSSEKSDDSTSASIDLDLPRRSRQVTFTCNKCGGCQCVIHFTLLYFTGAAHFE